MTKPEDDQPRNFLFHWFFNMLFAGIALLGGIAFGVRIPQSRISLLPILIPVVGVALIPLTRRWERSGIEKRRQAAKDSSKDKKG